MGKITIKHYLNTNLKPYMVRGESYYTTYVLITVNRKTTKVPSKEFAELQTEQEFEEFMYENAFETEVKTIENIIIAQLAICAEQFDPQLFSAFYNLLSNYYLGELSSIGMLVDISDYEDSRYMQSGYTLYDWFTPDVQRVLIERVEDLNKKPYGKEITNKNVKELNQAILIAFFELLDIISKSSSKYRDLQKRYEVYFDDYDGQAESILYKK